MAETLKEALAEAVGGIRAAVTRLSQARTRLEDKALAVKRAVDRVDQAFSGSWLGYHARMYYEGFEPPPTAFNVEWGGLVVQRGWREYQGNEVTSQIESLAGVKGDEVYVEVRDVIDGLPALRTRILAAVAPIRDIGGFEHEAELLTALEKRDVEQSPTEVLRSWRPRNAASRDSKALFQGMRAPAHYEYFSHVAAGMGTLNLWEEFFGTAEELVLQVVARLDRRVPPRVGASEMDGRRVLIIHGHATAARLELADLLEKRFQLTPVVLADIPHRGRTIIEKLEEEASSCGFAFAIFSPDDFVMKDGNIFAQARPNVIFELGWFYGRWGRKYTAVLYQQGTNIPSDMQGVGWIPFGDSVKEAFLAIEAELAAARMAS